jgi:hypothetical protein
MHGSGAGLDMVTTAFGPRYTWQPPRYRRFAMRVFEADWQRTQLPNSTTGAQNNLHLGAGLILRFY